jgi:hypothetical protein
MTTITVDRAVLEQAMEYLERSVDNYPIGYALSRRSHEAAIAALRQALEAEQQVKKVTVIAESLYERTGDIKDINTMLIGRDALQELTEVEAEHHRPVSPELEAEINNAIAEPVQAEQQFSVYYRRGYEAGKVDVNQFEYLDIKNHILERAMKSVMARLTELLDEDQFAEIEQIVLSAGVTP